MITYRNIRVHSLKIYIFLYLYTYYIVIIIYNIFLDGVYISGGGGVFGMGLLSGVFVRGISPGVFVREVFVLIPNQRSHTPTQSLQQT